MKKLILVLLTLTALLSCKKDADAQLTSINNTVSALQMAQKLLLQTVFLV
jgi:hypothetical protein